MDGYDYHGGVNLLIYMMIFPRNEIKDENKEEFLAERDDGIKKKEGVLYVETLQKGNCGI